MVRVQKWTVLTDKSDICLCCPVTPGFKVIYSKTCVKRPLKNRQNKALNDRWLLNEGRKYCRMLPLEHSAILLTCIKRSLGLKPIFGLFESGRVTQVLLYVCVILFTLGFLHRKRTLFIILIVAPA